MRVLGGSRLLAVSPGYPPELKERCGVSVQLPISTGEKALQQASLLVQSGLGWREGCGRWMYLEGGFGELMREITFGIEEYQVRWKSFSMLLVVL